MSRAVVAVAAAFPEFVYWAGSPSAVQDDDGTFDANPRTAFPGDEYEWPLPDGSHELRTEFIPST
jgi:hypothetical protein